MNTPLGSSRAENVPLMLLISVLLPPRALDDVGLLTEERTVRTPFGEVGPLARRVASEGRTYWVQPYSGMPARTDPRATLYAARALGCRRVLAWDGGVAVDERFARGETVIAADAIDWTRHQPDSYFASAGLEALSVDSEEPATFCPVMSSLLHDSFASAAPAVIVGVDGPRRETPAEARLFRAWGAAGICQNITPEAMLARELGICFAAIVTFNAYSRDQQREIVEGELRRGLEEAMQSLRTALPTLHSEFACRCQS